MIVESNVDMAYEWTWRCRSKGASVGVVPTMGALHPGHMSLVKESTSECSHTIATIFVNPTQFAPTEDLERYPRPLEEDLRLLERAGVDMVFTPANDAIYPAGFSTYVSPPEVAMTLEGSSRPEHFRGVTTIVLKLFQIIPASHGYFGQKDFQQAAVIKAMVRDLNIPINITVCPIVREDDGLAMSSRNRYLSEDERRRALGLSAALQAAAQKLSTGERSGEALQMAMRDVLISHGVDAIEYAVVADPNSLAVLPEVDRSAVALIAARVGETRLIDNQMLNL